MNQIWLNAVLASAGGAAPWYLAGGAPTPIAVYQPIGAASLAASYINLVNPGTFDAAPGVAPTWGALTGWGFNGTTQYLTTGIVPDSGDYWAIARYSNVVVAANQPVFGTFNGNNTTFYLYPQRRVSPAVSLAGHGGFREGAPSYTEGVSAINKDGLWHNGAFVAAMSASWAGPLTSSLDIWIGRSAHIAQYGASNVQAIAIYEGASDATIIAAVGAAAAAL